MELNIPPDITAEFDAVLRHCTLPGAVRVSYSLETNDKGAKSSLKYYDSLGQPIGDDRDYDILKSCFSRLNHLAETLAKRLIEQQTGNTDISPDDHTFELKIDLDLISGQMSASGQ